MFVLMNWACAAGLLALGVSVWARAARGCPAAWRYRAWWGALAAILVMPAAALEPGAPSGSSAPAFTDAIVELPARVATFGPLLVAAWAAWTTVAVARLAAAWLALRRVRRACRPFPAPRACRLTHWQTVRVQGRQARLMLSPVVDSAAVLGGTSPIIAVSPLLLRHLGDGDLDRIVLHEWAHVQRRDDVFQLLQEVIRALAGLHPAVWWATRQIRLERELACDERAAEITGSAKAYAACLARVAALISRPRAAALVPSALTGSQLAIRITRLVRRPSRPAPRRLLAWSGAVLVALAPAGVVRMPLVGVTAATFEVDVRFTGAHSTSESSAARGMPETVAMRPGIARSSPGLRPPAVVRAAPRRTVVGGLPQAASPRPPRATPWYPEPPPAAAPEASEPGVGLRALAGMPGGSVPMAAPVPGQRQPEVLQPTAGGVWSARGPDAGALQPDIPPRARDSAWTAAADAGVAVGSGMSKAGRATAGFFTRMGKSIGGAF